jgi:hypothetical protein
MDVSSLASLLGGQQAPVKGGTPPAPQGVDPGMISAWIQAQQAGQAQPNAGGVTGGVAVGNVNPLSQMLSQQQGQYQPAGGPVNGWGMTGDRMARFTPQGGALPIVPGNAKVPPVYTGANPNTITPPTYQPGGVGGAGGAGGAGGGGTGGGAGGGGAGGLPPINAGEDSMAYMLRIGMTQADADAALAMSKAHPEMSFQDIMAQMKGGGGTGGTPNLSQLTPPPAGNPTGAPAINTAMQKLSTGELPYDQRVTNDQLAQYRTAWKQSMVQPEGFRQWSKAQKAQWNATRSAAEQAYVEAQKRTGLGPAAYVLT